MVDTDVTMKKLNSSDKKSRTRSKSTSNDDDTRVEPSQSLQLLNHPEGKTASLREYLDESPVYQKVQDESKEKQEERLKLYDNQLEGYEDLIEMFLDEYFVNWEMYKDQFFKYFKDIFYMRRIRYSFKNPDAVPRFNQINPIERRQDFLGWMYCDVMERNHNFQKLLAEKVYKKYAKEECKWL